MTGDEVRLAEVAEQLRTVLAGIARAPDTTADPLHIAYLHGAADALAVVAETPEGDRPDPKRIGTPGHRGGDGPIVAGRLVP